MNIIANYTYLIYRGDTDVRSMDFYENAAKTIPYDLTKYNNWTLEVKKRYSAEPSIKLILGDGLEITSDNRMTFTIGIDKSIINASAYKFDLQGDNIGSDRLTILTGDFIVQQDITDNG